MIRCDMPGCKSTYDGPWSDATGLARWVKRGPMSVCPDCAADKIESPAQEIAGLRKLVAELRADSATLQRKLDERD